MAKKRNKTKGIESTVDRFGNLKPIDIDPVRNGDTIAEMIFESSIESDPKLVNLIREYYGWAKENI
jgi:hypothetical protein